MLTLELISKTVTWDTLIIIEYDSTQIAVSSNAIDLLDKELKERDILEVNIRYIQATCGSCNIIRKLV